MEIKDILNTDAVIGYPHWHPKSKEFPRKQKGREPGRDSFRGGAQDNYRSGQDHFKGQQKWNKNKGLDGRMAANVNVMIDNNKTDGNLVFTPQQFEQLLKNLPSMVDMTRHNAYAKDDFEANFAGIAYCHCALVACDDWILDSGASNHMTPHIDKLTQIRSTISKPKVNLPNGDTITISHTGHILLANDLTLKNTLCVPSFKHNLLSIQRLSMTTIVS